MRVGLSFKGMMLVFASTMALLLCVLLLGCLWSLSTLDRGISQSLPQANTFADALSMARYNTVQIQQFLNDASLTGDSDSFKEAQTNLDLLQQALDQARQANPSSADQIAQLKSKANALHDSGVQMANAYLKQGKAAGDAMMKQPGSGFDVRIDAMTSQLEALNKQSIQQYASTQDEMIRVANEVKAGVVIGVATVLAIFLLMMVWLYRAAVLPLAAMRKTVVEVIDHLDFSRRIQHGRQDEIGQTIQAFNRLLEMLQQSMKALNHDIGEVACMVQGLSQDSGKVSTRCAAQNEAASAMATNVEQMANAIAYVADQSQEAATVSARSGELAQQGRVVIESTVSDIHEISRSVKSVAECIHGLVDSSQQIGGVAQVISEIAEQTNLLALNAAIEAARAGEAGRGFAVVADEVRKLAERTTSSTNQIAQTIKAMQDSASEAVTSTDEAVTLVDRGVERASQVTSTIGNIQQGSEEAVRMATHISAAIREQGEVSLAIKQQIERIAAMTSDNSVVAHDTHQMATTLDKLTLHMHETIRRFRV
ncbi:MULTISPECIES: methyl-accepting chemotaxis protein [unclassified Paludibacterium]|uniref:methyl-accepting chemotaxis protein n=1 Tax=unclassified Paludibacterium TaxID=2618429 RepID=UPI001C03F974|nr:methyl-accepting chemotaxis protein [Paludibacterium sp. B53371]BEV70962.1 hypothetical protein THUN1379_04440 [Paludibacterium sp. THUN1379]